MIALVKKKFVQAKGFQGIENERIWFIVCKSLYFLREIDCRLFKNDIQGFRILFFSSILQFAELLCIFQRKK